MQAWGLISPAALLFALFAGLVKGWDLAAPYFPLTSTAFFHLASCISLSLSIIIAGDPNQSGSHCPS